MTWKPWFALPARWLVPLLLALLALMGDGGHLPFSSA